MSSREVVLSNSNVLKFILSFIDPKYENFNKEIRSDLVRLEYKLDYALVMLQVFKCVHQATFGQRICKSKRIKLPLKLLSNKRKCVISYSLCNWSVEMGMTTSDCIYSLACKWGSLPVLQQLINYLNPSWQPRFEDVKFTVQNGNVDQYNG